MASGAARVKVPSCLVHTRNVKSALADRIGCRFEQQHGPTIGVHSTEKTRKTFTQQNKQCGEDRTWRSAFSGSSAMNESTNFRVRPKSCTTSRRLHNTIDDSYKYIYTSCNCKPQQANGGVSTRQHRRLRTPSRSVFVRVRACMCVWVCARVRICFSNWMQRTFILILRILFLVLRPHMIQSR